MGSSEAPASFEALKIIGSRSRPCNVSSQISGFSSITEIQALNGSRPERISQPLS
jgi:hypothetical protein